MFPAITLKMKKRLIRSILFYAFSIIGVLYVSCAKKDSPLTKPSINILTITNVASGSSTIKVEITSNGNGTITETGVCFSTTVNPDITQSKIISAIKNGKYSCIIASLKPETLYYVRAYATNESGTAYSNELPFTTTAIKFWVPDVNFRTVLKQQFPLAFDTKDSLKISNPSVTGFKGMIDASNRTISSLSGIEYFTSLTQLSCNSNALTSLDLSKNTALLNLTCSSNLLTGLDLSKNLVLKFFTCDLNQLASLDLSKNTALEYLDCSNNKLTSLNLSKNIALISLFCYANLLTSIDISAYSSSINNLYIITDAALLNNNGNTGLISLKVNISLQQNPEIINIKTARSGCVISTWNNGIQVCPN
jgi:hypothetical protein